MHIKVLYLCTLKFYLRNKSHPEGFIAKGYIAKECALFKIFA